MKFAASSALPALFLLTSLALLSACNSNNHNNDGNAGTALSLDLGFTAPQSSFDLSNYTLIGKYDLPVGSGDNLLAAEASAVTYDKDTDSLYVVGDGGTSVVQVSKTGTLIDSMQLAKDSSQPQGTAFYDTEGITYIGGGQFVLAEERYRQIDLFTYAAGATLARDGAKTVKLGTTIGNIGIEGLSHDPASGGYVFVKEKTPEGIFQSTVDFNAGAASNGSPTTDESTNLFDPSLLGTADFADIFSLSNVLASDAADYDQLLVLSQESGIVLKVDRSGAIKGSLDIGITGQNEGMTMDGDHTLYIANELGGGEGHPQLWVYKPAASADAVGTGSKLYLNFNQVISIGSGNLVIDNGAGDSRTISVSDDDQVRIDGDTVTIDPSQSLIAGSTYTITVPDGAFKDANGAAITGVGELANLSFKTVADSDAPTLLSSNPEDNAAAVSGSHIVLTYSEPVIAGSGNIIISGSDGDVRTIAANDVTQVTIDGSTVDINPSADLHQGTAYNVQMASGVVADRSGNAYAGLTSADALNFTTASSTAPTTLAVGDLLLMAANADDTDAIAFVLLKDVTAGTQIGFTDKDYTTGGAWPTNEAAYTWTADVAYPAGTIVTIATSAPSVDKGAVAGSGGGISGSAETYYAFQGTITDADTGNITVDHFLAAINVSGGDAGDIPPELVTASTYISFTQNDVKYTGSLDLSDPAAFAARVKDAANWTTSDSAGFPLTDGSLFP